MSSLNQCPQCGAQLPPDAPRGVCPKCLMQQGFESHAAESAGGQSIDATVTRSNFVAPSPEALAPLFPQYEIVELLGKGGMGAVYKARQPSLDRHVALKILPPEVSADPAFSERFLREARSLAMLNHSCIVAVYDFGEADGLYYFVMEYVDGANLRQTIEAGGLTPQEALLIVPQICDALQFAHDEGVVHRDIKPENILIDSRGRVKIADFGLAKLLGMDDSKTEKPFTLTGTHQVMGTPRYMAPEQMQGSSTVDHRADIYSLGVVFYEMLTGELPLGRFDPPSERVRIDVRLDEVVLRSLESTPDRRYQHASDVKTDVESIVSATNVQIAQPRARAADKPNWVRGRLKAPAIGLLVAGVVNMLAAVPIALIPFLVRAGYLGTPFHRQNMDAAESAFFVVVAVVSLLTGIMLLLGAARMLDLQNWGIALFGALAAIVPCALGFPISLPCGIWALVVLSRRDVSMAFADWEAPRAPVGQQQPASTLGPAMAIGTGIGMSAGLVVGAVTGHVGIYIVAGMTLGLLAGLSIDSQRKRSS